MTQHDEAVLDLVSRMVNFYHPDELNLLHVVEDSDLPPEIMKDFPDLHKPQKQKFLDIMEEKRKMYFPDVTETKIVVEEGEILTGILGFLVDNDSDFVIIGNGPNSGSMVKKIARKSSSSVLIIPSTYNSNIRHIAASTDFSGHSVRALQITASLAEGLNIPKVTAAHVYKDASRYVGESIETAYDVNEVLVKRASIDKKLQEYAQHKLEDHLKEAYPGGDVNQLALNTKTGRKKSDALVEWIKDSDVDFMVMGAKGQSTAAAVLLGSFAEEVYTRLNQQIILLFKKKGENRKFLKALLGR